MCLLSFLLWTAPAVLRGTVPQKTL